jgi:hypothetical protein
MPWAWILFAANDPEKIKSLVNSDEVLTLDEIDFNIKTGKYSYKK